MILPAKIMKKKNLVDMRVKKMLKCCFIVNRA